MGQFQNPPAPSVDEFKYADANEILTLTQEQAKEIIALLKEQEAVKPQLSISGLWYECPICHRHLTKNSDNYCARCGRAVLWEGR